MQDSFIDIAIPDNLVKARTIFNKMTLVAKKLDWKRGSGQLSRKKIVFPKLKRQVDNK